MSITLNISHDIDARVNWEKLAKDLKEKFNIEGPEEDIVEFCCQNESQYLAIETFEPEIKKTNINDLTGY